jgi:hypothetical protein
LTGPDSGSMSTAGLLAGMSAEWASALTPLRFA